MNRAEARLELDATTLRPQDASPEVRAMLAGDPALAAWHAKRTAFDESVADVFASAIPVGLHESILENTQRPAKPPVRWVLPALISTAAVFAFGWTLFWPVSGEMPDWQAESLAAVTKVEYGMTNVDHLSRDLEAIKQLLISDQAPTPARLPGTVGGMTVLACKRIQVAGRVASIICFEITPGKEAHLVVMDNTGLSHPPPQLQPQFKNSKNWNMASWSDGSQTFLLATTADAAELKKLFGLA